MTPAHDSGFIVCGKTFSADGDVAGGHGGADAWVVKLSNDGAVVWQHAYGGSQDDGATQVRRTADGGYILAGATWSADGDIIISHGLADCWVVKLDGAGNLQWQKTYGGSGYDEAYDVQQTSDGGYIIAGITASSDGDVTGYHGGTGADCWVVKTDDTGAIMWQRTYGGTRDEGAIVVRQTQDNGYIFGGFTMSNNGDVTNYHGGTSDGGDCWVVRLNSFGNLKWQKTYGGTFEEQVFDIFETSPGKYIAGASSRSYNGDVAAPLGHVDAWVLSLDDTGGIALQKSYGTPLSEHLTRMCRTADNGFAFTGWNEGLWVGNIDSAGAMNWEASFGGSSSDEGWGICPAGDGGYIVAGQTASSDGDVSGYHGGSRDMWVVKVAAPSGISTLAGNLSGVKIYPNPATSLLNIEGAKTAAVARLFSISGAAAGSWRLKTGSSHLAIDHLPPGIYQLQLTGISGEQRYERIVKLH